jgi:hypothetical protein
VIRLAPPIADVASSRSARGFCRASGTTSSSPSRASTSASNEPARSVDASFDSRSLRVVRALRDGVELPDAITERDRRTIEEAIRRDVLETGTYSEIRFRSTRIVDVDAASTSIGRLALHGGRARDDRSTPARRTTATRPKCGLHQHRLRHQGLQRVPRCDDGEADVLVRVSLRSSPPPRLSAPRAVRNVTE